MTALVVVAERRPALAPLMLSAIVAGLVITVFTVETLTTRPLLPWWSIVVAYALEPRADA